MPRSNEPTERMCIVSREVRPVAELIRFVLDPEGRVVPDLRRRLPGHGAHVRAQRTMIDEAVKRRLFARAFKGPAAADPALGAQVDELMMAGLLSALSMARKGGTLVTGFAKVESALAAGQVAALVHAADAADDGIRKLEAAARRAGAGMTMPSVRIFSSEQLGLALGRAHVIHAALLAGRPSEDVLQRLSALVRFRGTDEAWSGGNAQARPPVSEADAVRTGQLSE